ncbi:MAG: glycosyltransferase [Rugosibacter sp.]|nr:glycosyltransferase [Rugosibacter sp.]MDD3381793.1 glycosyltransferase [Rugosibacter sp.]
MITKSVTEITQRWQSRFPLVSICCITYNQAFFLSEAMDSLLSQETDFPFEIIIGDDASSDGTNVIIEQYKSRYDSLIKTIVNDINIGAIANISKVMSLASGKYIAICEGDDYWHDPKKIQLQVDFLERNPSFSMCCHDYKVRRGDDVFANDSPCGFDILSIDEYAKTMPNIQTLTVLFKNELKPLIPENMIQKVTGSVFMFLRLAEIGNIKYIDIPLATYRVHGAGIWSGKTMREKGEMALQNINAMQEYFFNKPKILRLLTERYIYQSVAFSNHSILKFSLVDFTFFAKKSISHGFLLIHFKALATFYLALSTKIFKKLLKIC